MPPLCEVAGAECGSILHSVSPPGTPPSDRMFLRGVEAHGYHGVFDTERTNGQRFIVDVDWWVETVRAVRDDKLGSTLCYKQVFDTVVGVITGQAWELIETLAERISSVLLDRFPTIGILTVTVHKPDAPIGGRFADVGVSISRARLAGRHSGDGTHIGKISGSAPCPLPVNTPLTTLFL